jgi:hypothetical protein
MSVKALIGDAELIRLVHSDFHRRRFDEGQKTFTAVFMGGERRLNGEHVAFGVDTKREAVAAAREYGARFLNGAKVICWLDLD